MKKGHNVGYMRVSTIDQSTARQLDGIELDKTFEEKASAKDTKRPALQECLAYLREGDTLHVHSIDRLARNTENLLQLTRELTGRGVSIQFHKERLTFTGEDNPFQKLQLQMMGAFAEFERSLIKERQREGISKAKQEGRNLGRKPKLTAVQVEEIKARIAQGTEKKALAAEYGISRVTLYAAINDHFPE